MISTQFTAASNSPAPVDFSFWRSHAKFIVENITAAVVAVDTGGYITIFNSEAERIFAKSTDQVLGEPLQTVFPGLPFHEYYLLQILLQDKDLSEMEYNYCPYTDKSGTFHHCVATVSDKHGQTQGAIWLRKDLTDERRYQQEINKADIQAIVSQIAAATAHEIRNPLTTAQGYIQLAKINCSEEVGEHLQTAIEELKSINKTITDLLAFLQPGADGLQFISINSLLEELLQLMANVGSMNNIEINSHLDNETPLCLLDRELVKQAVLNMLRNAIDAMPSGGQLTVKTSFCSATNEVIITSTDSGAAIPSKDIDHIFKPFISMNASSHCQGLILTNRIVQHQGGYMDVFSEKGVGTTVKITFPVS